MTISYKPADVASSAGARRLLGRIETAARNECTLPDGSIFSQVRLQERACEAPTVANAVRKLNAPLVTADYQSQWSIRHG